MIVGVTVGGDVGAPVVLVGPVVVPVLVAAAAPPTTITTVSESPKNAPLLSAIRHVP